MTDLYAILELDRNVAPQAIRNAWKRLSSRYHPDRKGGDAAKMAEVNRAYEVLSDPEKREHYDATAELDLPKPFDRIVMENAMGAIKDAMESNTEDVVTAAKALVQQKLNDCSAMKQNIRNKIAQVERQREGAKPKKQIEQNLFHMVIDQKLQQMRGHLEMAHKTDDLLVAVFKLLEDYESGNVFMEMSATSIAFNSFGKLQRKS